MAYSNLCALSNQIVNKIFQNVCLNKSICIKYDSLHGTHYSVLTISISTIPPTPLFTEKWFFIFIQPCIGFLVFHDKTPLSLRTFSKHSAPRACCRAMCPTLAHGQIDVDLSIESFPKMCEDFLHFDLMRLNVLLEEIDLIICTFLIAGFSTYVGLLWGKPSFSKIMAPLSLFYLLF